jgi:3-hydroxybutyryl-CoA dehydrogenase
MNFQSRRMIGVVGGGTMGRGIVQLLAQSGNTVRCYDAAPGMAHQATEYVVGMLKRAVDKGKLKATDVDAMATCVAPADALADLAECDVVIEAVVEDLEIKRSLFRALEQIVSDTTILATNTSSLGVSEIAAACRRPERVAGLHFFNPVPLMKVVEVIPGLRTAAAIVEQLKTLVSATGHRAVVADDQPGFLVNHAGRGLYTEGLRILEEQVASVADIDSLLRDAGGFRMGPFELLDLTGLDVSGKVLESIYERFQQEPRFRPSSLVPPRVAAGLFGRKSGEGWYVYEGDRRREGPARVIPSVPSGLRVWIDPLADDHVALRAMAQASGAQIESTAERADVLMAQFWGRDATGYCVEQGLPAGRCVAIDPLPGLGRRRTLMLTTTTTADARDAGLALLGADGTAVTIINDSPGFIVQRVLATIVNIAADIAQRGIAAVPDIEDAVRLGLGYPQGPLTWGDQIGGRRLLTILSNMQARTGDTRYRPSPWLLRRAELGSSLLTPEAAR